MDRERDSQRSKVYAAERAAWAELIKLRPELDVTYTKADAIRELRALAERKRITTNYPRALWLAKVEVTISNRGGSCYPGWTPRIRLGSWARTRHFVILHEAAHQLQSRESSAHGWEFCDAHLALWRARYGVDAAKVLEHHYKAAKVRYRKPRAKKVLTPDQKAVLSERLAVARAAKLGKGA